MEILYVLVARFNTVAVLHMIRLGGPAHHVHSYPSLLLMPQFKHETHVTLWHCDDPVLGPQRSLRDALLSRVGDTSFFQVTAIDYEPGGTAAAVVEVRASPLGYPPRAHHALDMQLANLHLTSFLFLLHLQLLDAPEAATVKPYHHITLVVGEGQQAKDANLLPQKVQEGKATRVPLQDPLQITGQILGFTQG
jgi:hypothetical protein